MLSLLRDGLSTLKTAAVEIGSLFTKSVVDEREEALHRSFGYTAQEVCFNPNTKESLVTLAPQMKRIVDFRDMDAAAIGYPAVSVDAILAAHHKMITDVYAAAGLTQEQLNELLLPTIRELARTIHLIPASGGFHHKDCGGLFVHSLETAWAAAQKCKGRYFQINRNDPNNIETQRKMLLAVMLAALCHDAGKVLSDVTIKTDPDNGKRFSPHSEKLADWMLENKLDRYYVFWKGKGKDHELELTNLYNDLISKKVRAYLGERISYELYKFFTNQIKSKGESTLADLVSEADSQSTAHDRKRGQFDRSHKPLSDRESTNFFTAVKRLLLIGAKTHDEHGDAYPTKVKGKEIMGWTINTLHPAMLVTADGHFFVSWERFIEVRKIYEIERVNSGCFETGTVIAEEVRAISSTSPEEKAMSLLDILYSQGYLKLNPEAGKYRAQQYFWKVGRYDVEDPGGPIYPFKAVCLTKEAADKIFSEPGDSPTEVRIYALFGTPEANGEDTPRLMFATDADRLIHERALAYRSGESVDNVLRKEAPQKEEVKDEISIPTRKELEQKRKDEENAKRKHKDKAEGEETSESENEIVEVRVIDGIKYAVDADGTMRPIRDEAQTEEPSSVGENERDSEESEDDTEEEVKDINEPVERTAVVDVNKLKVEHEEEKEEFTLDDPAFNFGNNTSKKESQKRDDNKTRQGNKNGGKTDQGIGQSTEKGADKRSQSDIKDAGQTAKVDSITTEAEPAVTKQSTDYESIPIQAKGQSEESDPEPSATEVKEQDKQLFDNAVKDELQLDMSFFNKPTKKEQQPKQQSKASGQSKPTKKGKPANPAVPTKSTEPAKGTTLAKRQQRDEQVSANAQPNKPIPVGEQVDSEVKKTAEVEKSASDLEDDLMSVFKKDDRSVDNVPNTKEADVTSEAQSEDKTQESKTEKTDTSSEDPEIEDISDLPDSLYADEDAEPFDAEPLPPNAIVTNMNPEIDEFDKPVVHEEEEEPKTDTEAPEAEIVNDGSPLPFDDESIALMGKTEFLDALVESLKRGAAMQSMMLSADPVTGYYFTSVQLEDLAKRVTKSARQRKQFLLEVRANPGKGLEYDKLSGRVTLKKE